MDGDAVSQTRAPRTPQQRIDAALSALPRFGAAKPTLGAPVPSLAMPMHLSLDSVSMPVEVADGQGLLAKAFRADALRPYTFDDAAAGATAAGTAGIAPLLVAASTKEEVLVFERLGTDWRMALAGDLRKPDVKSAVLAAKKKWHGQPRLAITLSPFEVARDYAARLQPHLDPASSFPIPFKGNIAFPQAMQWIARIEEALAASGTDTAPIHGENAASNVMIGPDGRILLVDFDRAVNADPMLDLGSLCLEFCRNDRERMEAVEIYTGTADRAALARVKLYGIVDDFAWACWALLAQVNPGMAGPEWLKYASNRLIRMNYHLQTFDMCVLLASA